MFKILTDKKIKNIKDVAFNEGEISGIKTIVNFFTKLKNINIYEKPMHIKTDKTPIIKNSLFALNEYGIYVSDKKLNSKKKK